MEPWCGGDPQHHVARLREASGAEGGRYRGCWRRLRTRWGVNRSGEIVLLKVQAEKQLATAR